MNRRDFLKGLLASGTVVVATPQLLAQAGLPTHTPADVIWFPVGFRLDMPAKPDLLFLNGILLREGDSALKADYHATDKAVIFFQYHPGHKPLKTGDVVAITFWAEKVEAQQQRREMPWERQLAEVSLLQAIKKAYEKPVYTETFYLVVGDPTNPLASRQT